jgi:hypothetical protein
MPHKAAAATIRATVVPRQTPRAAKQERRCCAFLVFDLDQQPDSVCVTITAPEAAREAADVLFGQFVVGKANTQLSASRP